METQRLVYSVGDFAEIFGVSVPSVYNYIASGSLPVLKVGKRTLITAATVSAIIRKEIVLVGRTKEAVAARATVNHP